MRTVLAFAYGVTAYAASCGTFLYAIGFIGNIFVPKSIDSAPQGPRDAAVAINLLLLAVFAVQHSVMARPCFKRWWTRCVPAPVERSTYTLFSSLALMLVFWQWRPVGGTVWEVDGMVGRSALYSVFAFGWLLLLVATFSISHCDLFGVRQVWLYCRGRAYEPPEFETPWLYRHIRHPLHVGWLCAVWAAPTMTVTHLLFAAGTTAYVLVATQWEERNLVEAHPEYAIYRRRVPKFLPRIGTGREPPSLKPLTWDQCTAEEPFAMS